MKRPKIEDFKVNTPYANGDVYDYRAYRKALEAYADYQEKQIAELKELLNEAVSIQENHRRRGFDERVKQALK